MLGDEGAYGNDRAYMERLNTALPGATWLWAGVPNGIRGTKFHRISETSEGAEWSIHKYDIRANVLYHSIKAIRNAIKEHGGVNTQGFQTQVLGNWGEAAVASFPIIPSADVMPFSRIDLTGDIIGDDRQGLPILLRMTVPKECTEFVLGADMGYSPSPTIIFVFGLLDEVWWQFARVSMLTASTVQQARVFDTIVNRVLPKRPAFGVLDAHVYGRGILDNLQGMPEFDNGYYREKFLNAQFGSSIPDERIKIHRPCGQVIRRAADDGFMFCDHCKVAIFDPKDVKNAVIPVKQDLTIRLKESLLHGQRTLDVIEYNKRKGRDYGTERNGEGVTDAEDSGTESESLLAGVG